MTSNNFDCFISLYFLNYCKEGDNNNYYNATSSADIYCEKPKWSYSVSDSTSIKKC